MPVLNVFDADGRLLPDAGLRVRRAMGLRVRGAGAEVDLRQGFGAGLVLQACWAVYTSTDKGCSLKQGIRLAAAGGNRDHARLGGSVASIERAWRKHRPAASLYAGWLWAADLPMPDGEDATPYILRASEFLRRFGENFYPLTGRTRSAPGKRPLLDPELTWKCPPHGKLPDIPRDWLVQRLTPAGQERLSKGR